MECPYCETDLTCTDFYGRNLRLDSLDRVKDGFEKEGDIFRCDNEDCEMYEESFYTDRFDELHDGYPC